MVDAAASRVNEGPCFRRGDLARLTGVGAEAIRWYEREGLLRPPERTASNYRLYDEGHVAELKALKRLRDLGFEFDLIKQLVAASRDELDASQADDVVRALRVATAEKFEQIKQLKALLASLEERSLTEQLREIVRGD